MKVFKFGGASINSAERMANTAKIIKGEEGKLLVVVSAMGKTTNALEAVAESFFEGNNEIALKLFDKIKTSHLQLIKFMVTQRWQQAEERLKTFFTETEWLLHDKPLRNFDYYYDQIVCTGELMSSSILADHLNEQGCNCAWIDVRDILRTDDNFRDASVDWAFTGSKIKQDVLALFEKYDVVITQGYIGSTDENESTTLGREGSDYSAAVFANLLPAESVTIWKDVEAVMNADPRIHHDAIKIAELSYNEVIEMAYYGAQVIHPKTIKPLQNKGIPLFVKSFIDPSLPGTAITKTNARNIPPIIIHKNKQVLISFKSKDFSFVEGKPMDHLLEIFRTAKVKSNLSQHTAISLLCCFDEHTEKIGQIAEEASALFDVEVTRGLSLLTIRHYTPGLINKMNEGKEIILEQRTVQTCQLVLR
ncbi:MAG: aspartate kinase [Chitinophagaceae bacterium]|nr:MAG: aspartate kinase [Chitinophagaceae bacterium]